MGALLDVSPLGWVAALIITYLAAMVQGAVGLGFALVSVPVLALIDPVLAPVPQLLITLPLTVTMAWREREHVALHGVGWIVTGRIPGAAIGVLLLAVASQAALELIIAVFVLAAVGIIGSGVHIRRTPVTQFGAGLFSGVSGFVASIGGPPLALLYARDEGPVVRSNLASVFVLGLLITLVARVASGNLVWADVQVAAVLFPALVAGYLTSLAVKDRLSQSSLRRAILVLSVVGALGLIVRTLIS